MKSQAFICLLCFAFLNSTCYAQSGSWQAVQSLAPGTRIQVLPRYQRLVECEYQSATQEELTCVRYTQRRFTIPIVFPRTMVRQVALLHSNEAKAALGGAIGVGTGAVVGYNIKGSGSLTREGNALVLGLLGGAVGAALGHAFSTHREVIYRGH